MTSTEAANRIQEVVTEIGEVDDAILRIEVKGHLTDTQEYLSFQPLTQMEGPLHVIVVPEITYGTLSVREDASEEEIMNKVLTELLGIPARDVHRWRSLAQDVKHILLESTSEENVDAVIELLEDFSKKGGRRAK